MDKGVFYEVRCDNKQRRKGNRPCNQYLGEIQKDVPNISRHFCHACHIMYRHTVNSEGIVVRDTPKDWTLYTDMVARIDES